MAGIGFELRKLFHGRGLINQTQAYAYSSLTTIGPMVVCMAMVVAMQVMMSRWDTPYLERELFLTTLVYAFIFSVLITGGLSMVLTRFIADMLFEKRHEHLLSSFYGACAICLPIGTVTAWLFLRDVDAGFGYKTAAYFLFMELILLLLQTVHLSALKNYKRIVRSFVIGTAIAAAGAWLLLRFTPYGGATGLLVMMDIGFFVSVLLVNRHFEQYFPPKNNQIYFSFLSYFSKYPSLFFIGTFFYAGVYVHTFVYWLGPGHTVIADKYFIAPFYDMPVFYAYLSVVPTLVTFVVSVETTFYEKFRSYYDKILHGGTWAEIRAARKQMQQTLMQEIGFIMEVQLIFTVISIALGIKLLPLIGFTMEQLDTFNMLLVGYYLFMMSFVIMLLLLYFDDRKGVLYLSSLFVLLNTGLSIWTMLSGRHGLGMFLAALVTLILTLYRMVTYVNNIDYYTFCAQPIAAKPHTNVFRRLMGKKTVLPLSLVLVLLLSACSSKTPVDTAPESTTENAAASTASSGLNEDKRLYERDEDTSVMALYITVLPEDDDVQNPLSWYALNRISGIMDTGELKVIVQEGSADGSGPTPGRFGYNAAEANGKITLRGNTARYASQKSYKIKLNDQAGLWQDQRTLNLNKHILDSTRIRNKLSFDIFETLPNMTSLRTQFVHLYVKDRSEATASQNVGFEDYGLYTQIEQPNEKFLKNHWLDPYGQLYKVNMFEFLRYPEALKSQSDPDYDKAIFETHLQINGREEHDKLLAMLDDVNDVSIPINDVIEEHFDLDNYLTWLASNILMDNMDTDAQNYFLYSPLNSNTWYFLPWDYDGGWEQQRKEGAISDYANGLSNYWGVKLHNRFFRIPANVKKLEQKMDELYKSVLSENAIAARVESYRAATEGYLARNPDKQFLPVPISQLDQDYANLSRVPERSIARFKEDLQKPKPFFLGDLETVNGKPSFVWDPSFDFQGDDITYEWTLAKDPAFMQIVAQHQTKDTTYAPAARLAPGTYYWRVLAKDPQGNQQIAFDIFFDDEGDHYYGVREVQVN